MRAFIKERAKEGLILSPLENSRVTPLEISDTQSTPLSVRRSSGFRFASGEVFYGIAILLIHSSNIIFNIFVKHHIG